MGLIHIELFATLDLVGQSPGGPDEDPVGFPFGGWQAPLLDEVAGAQVGAAYEGTDALLLGRREPEPGADPPAREALRPSRPLGAPGRARRREEGVRRWRGAHERHTPRT